MLMCSVAQIVEYRLARESLVKRLEPKSGRTIKTKFGDFQTYLYQSVTDPLPQRHGRERCRGATTPPQRLSACTAAVCSATSSWTLASSPDAASGDTLHESMRMIQKLAEAIVYLRTTNAAAARRSHRSRRARSKRRAAASSTKTSPDLQARAQAASVMPLCEYGVGCQILQPRPHKLRLITNSDRSLPGIEHFALKSWNECGRSSGVGAGWWHRHPHL